MNNATFRKRAIPLLAGLAGVVLAATAHAEVSAREGWAAATAPGEKTGALYFTLSNDGPETRKLLKIITPVSDELMVHQSSVTEQGVTRLWPMAVLSVEGGQTLRLAPGGLRVTLRSLKSPLVAGQKIPLTMKFDGGQPEFTLLIEVRGTPANAGGR